MTRRTPGGPAYFCHGLLALLLVLGGGCASSGTGLLGGGRADTQDLDELKARVLELQRKVTVAEVELDRLRRRVAELEGRRGGEPVPRQRSGGEPTAALTPPPGGTAPEAPGPRPAEIEEADLEEPERAAPAPAGPRAPLPADPEPEPDSEPAPPTPAPAQELTPAARDLYDEGYAQFHQGHYLDAESTFQRFLRDHAGTDLADNAQYWIGEARYARGDYRGALAAFTETIERYPTGNKVPDSLLKAGRCLEELGDVEGARARYREVSRRFPGTAAAVVAEERRAALP